VSARFTARVLFSGEAAPSPRTSLPPGVRVTPAEGRLADDAIDRAARGAWYWPGAKDALASHRSYVELSLAAEVGTPIARALALTHAVSSLAGWPGVIAVVWDATGLAHEPAAWIAQAEDATAEDLPLFLWIAFEGKDDAGGTRSLCTRGLAGFDALEVQVEKSKRDGEEVLETVCDVALYVLTSPAALEDGDQVEVTLGKVRVRIEPSLANDGTRAYRLRLP
jgi:hypothetical protein